MKRKFTSSLHQTRYKILAFVKIIWHKSKKLKFFENAHAAYLHASPNNSCLDYIFQILTHSIASGTSSSIASIDTSKSEIKLE